MCCIIHPQFKASIELRVRLPPARLPTHTNRHTSARGLSTLHGAPTHFSVSS